MTHKQTIKTIVALLTVCTCLAACNNSTSSSQTAAPEVTTAETTDASTGETLDLAIEIPVAGNSWILDNLQKSEQLITENGIKQWSNKDDQLVTYVYLTHTGSLNLGVKTKRVSGDVTLNVRLDDQQQMVKLAKGTEGKVTVGTFNISKLGYQKIIITGVEKADSYYPEITHLAIGGAAASNKHYYVKDDFYWGRRGPSVHLNFTVPDESQDYEWFYSELEVPSGQDTLGSYFMANGFGEGYMGIQVNSPTERRVLFSVWSPYQTDDPSSIPDEYKIELLKKGPEVNSGEFGNEGSGGQSYLVYNWQADTRYRFLLQVKPSEQATDNTEYTAYFYSPESAKWQLIASFRRPKTSTYVTRPHSFLENFIPAAGQFERKAIYDNQWLRTVDGEWQEMTNASFTYDATAMKEARLDYQGGTTEQGFFLRNTGFFSAPTEYNSFFNRRFGTYPQVELTALPK